MNKITGKMLIPFITQELLIENEDKKITVNACIHKIKKSSGFSFIYLRTGRMLLQGISTKDTYIPKEIGMGVYVRAEGIVKKEPRAEYGYEISLTSIVPLSYPKEKYPLNVADKTLAATLEINIDNRSVALRHPDKRAILKICEGVTCGFRDFMLDNNFTEIHTPKITLTPSRSESTAFPLKYFGKDAYLSQSPQLYKQTAVAFFDRVFEVGAAYYAGKHTSARHLNEYTSLDFEIGFINDITDVMHVLTGAIQRILQTLPEKYKYELTVLNAVLPSADSIEAITFDEAIAKLNKDYTQYNLDPTDELRLCDGKDFVFVSEIPKQPFYNKQGFVLLFRGMEVACGGERIYDYDELVRQFDGNHEFVNLHRYGIAPHGGGAIGLERFVTKLLKLENTREASIFPRDMHHLEM